MKDHRRLMLMVAALHRLGYGRLRLIPGMSPSGMHWRCRIAPASLVSKSHGARFDGPATDADPVYSSSEQSRFFGWKDAKGDTPDALARKFVERFPEIAEAGRGADPGYERWYAEMLAATEPDGAIIAYADWYDSTDSLRALDSPVDSVPLPPPGEAEA